MKSNFVTKKIGLLCVIMMLLVATVAVFSGCNDDKVKSISITTDPIKTTYLAGEKFDATGMIITVEYKNGNTEAIKFADNNNPKNDGYTYDLYKKSLTTADTQVTFSFKGKKVTLKITVNKRNMDAPKVELITYIALNGALTVTPIDGAEYKLALTEWQDSNVFSGLTNGTTYDLSVRFKASDYNNASEVTTITGIKIMGTQNAISGSAIVISVTDTTITVEEIAGAEYKLDNGEWGSAREFTGLTANTSHTVYVRMAETETALASESTAKTAITKPTPTIE